MIVWALRARPKVAMRSWNYREYNALGGRRSGQLVCTMLLLWIRATRTCALNGWPMGELRHRQLKFSLPLSFKPFRAFRATWRSSVNCGWTLRAQLEITDFRRGLVGRARLRAICEQARRVMWLLRASSTSAMCGVAVATFRVFALEKLSMQL